MSTFKTRIRSWFRSPISRHVLKIEEMPDWLLHDIGMTRDGTRLGPDDLPARIDRIGRL